MSTSVLLYTLYDMSLHVYPVKSVLTIYVYTTQYCRLPALRAILGGVARVPRVQEGVPGAVRRDGGDLRDVRAQLPRGPPLGLCMPAENLQGVVWIDTQIF